MPHDHHKLPPPGHARIEQVTLKQRIVLHRERDDDRRILRSLAPVDRHGGCAAWGGEADVVSARAIRTVNGSFSFEVTIRNRDRGWDHYADRFEVLPRNGTVLGVRQLAHPDVDEQPFTRELNGVLVSDTLDTVVIRAHHQPRGYDGATVQLELPR